MSTSALKFLLVLQLAFICFDTSTAQVKDSTKNKLPQLKSTAKKQLPDSIAKNHSPRKATILSAACPGLGQIYNRKYWKLPIIYGGIGVTGYLFTKKTIDYLNYRTALRLRLDNDSTTNDIYPEISNETLLSEQNRFHRSRDFMAIIFCAIYALQVVDASVDAHLFYFDVSDDLSLHIFPSMLTNNSIGLCFNFNIHSASKSKMLNKFPL